jgi:serine/threonine protein kinase
VEFHNLENCAYFIIVRPELSLETAIQERGLPALIETKKYLREVASVLFHLHANTVLLGNLSVENIFLDERNSVVIANFQSSQEWGNYTDFARLRRGPLVPDQRIKPTHAPEIIKGEYNYKVDLWAFGCVMVYLWIGRYPFKPKAEPSPGGRQPSETCQEGLTSQSVTWEKCSDYSTIPFIWQDLIEKYLEPDLEKRSEIFPVMVHPLMK